MGIEDKLKIMKKSKTKKKVKKSKTKKTSPVQEVRIVVQSAPPVLATPKDLEPIKEENKYTLAKSWVSEKLVHRMVQKTPLQHVYKRPGKGGQVWSYVTGNYVEKVLNFVFGWNWDFEVTSHGTQGDQVWVLGKLTVKDDAGHTITKTQFGRADIKFKKGSKDMLDFGNDLKAATTDSLKKAASLLGIASDIYGKTEIKQETGYEMADKPELPSGEKNAPTEAVVLKKGQKIGPDGTPTWVCEKDGDPISDQEAEYSLKIYGKRLCREHQQEAKKK